MLPEAPLIICLSVFQKEGWLATKWPFTSKDQYFKVVSRLWFISYREKTTDIELRFLANFTEWQSGGLFTSDLLVKNGFSVHIPRYERGALANWATRSEKGDLGRSRTCASICCSNLTELSRSISGVGVEPTTYRAGGCFLDKLPKPSSQVAHENLMPFGKVSYNSAIQRHPTRPAWYFKKCAGNTYTYGQAFLGLWPKPSLVFHAHPVALGIAYLPDARNQCSCSAT